MLKKKEEEENWTQRNVKLHDKEMENGAFRKAKLYSEDMSCQKLTKPHK